MSNNQQAPKPKMKARIASAKASAKAQTTDKVAATTKGFDQQHPKVLKSAKTTNKVFAWVTTVLGVKVVGFAAIVTAVITALYFVMATIGLGDWSAVVKPALITLAFVAIYLWAESSTSK